MDNSELGSRIALIREQKGISKSELSRMVDCNRATITRMEDGTIDIKFSTLSRVLKALDANIYFTNTKRRK